jgi:TetR/AcrR family transcriptional regulator, transcriptional repressor for nem operon
VGKGEETKQRIIAEAATLFNRRGYNGSSLQDVMEATGLEKGGIYRHFSSKEELAVAAFDHAWSQAFEVRQYDLDSITNNVDKLKQLITNFVERRPSTPGGCPLLNTAVDADDGNQLLRDRARKALRAFQGKVGALVEAGIEQGEIRSKVDKRMLSNLIIASLEGALMIARLERNDEALRDARAHWHAYIETEVRKVKARK